VQTTEVRRQKCVCINLPFNHFCCNSETCTLKEEHKLKLTVFEMSVLGKILGFTQQYCSQDQQCQDQDQDQDQLSGDP